MKYKILVIEDDMDISNLICMNLETAGYETTAVYDGNEAADCICAEKDYDLALLDLMLPGRDGFSLIEPLIRHQIPVLCLTARGDVVSKVRGLKMGAEDYMVKPFEILELLVRIEKILVRTGKEKTLLTFRNLRVDIKSHKVYEGTMEIELKPMEFRLLTVFLHNRNIMLPRNRLLDLVWGEDFLGESRTVDVHVAKLRKKLKSCQEAIITVPRGGYLLSKDELKELSDSLNSMSDQIQQQIEDLEMLLGTMAHEMKTPLTSIMGYADSLLHVHLNEQQKEQSLEAIYRSAGRLNQMSGKLLQLIGLYENQEIENEAVNLSQVLKDIYEENREILKEKNIRFQMFQNGVIGVQGDKVLLTSLFDNLVSNSIKALDNSGEICVNIDSVKREICVEDNGRGIPKEDLPHVTKAFYMVDKSTLQLQM